MVVVVSHIPGRMPSAAKTAAGSRTERTTAHTDILFIALPPMIGDQDDREGSVLHDSVFQPHLQKKTGGMGSAGHSSSSI
jgi:hypothetical protein